MTVAVVLLCPGRVINHGDGTYECTAADCPGPAAAHPWYSSCACPEHTVFGPFDCYPESTADRRWAA